MVEARALVIGYGSIGKRHHDILSQLNCEVAIVSRRANLAVRQYPDILSALADWSPDYVVIASRTSEHANDLAILARARFQGKVLVEKPIFETAQEVPPHQFSALRVGFNLRCNPLYDVLVQAIDGQTLLAVHGYVGQYLPDWRPEQDYRTSYSASADQGGGVLLDLSHDIDIMAKLTGDWLRLTACGGQISPLEITSDDYFSIMMTHAECPLSTLTLNYLDRTATRAYVVHTAESTLRADFIEGTLDRNGAQIFKHSAMRNETYQNMHQQMLGESGNVLCTASEALDVLNTISAVRTAAEEKSWINHA